MANVVIYECLYSENQASNLSGAHPLHIANNNPERRELQAYVEVFKRQLYSPEGYTGVFSPKFELKCHIPLSEFIDFASHQHVSACHINPFPQIAYWSFNVWEQGEIAHPGLIKAAQLLLDATGLVFNIESTPRQGPELLAYGNFWAGDLDFWLNYVGQVLVPISEFLDQNPNHAATLAVLQKTRHTDAAPLLPFIIERLYSSWIATKPLSFASYSYTAEEIVQRYCNNAFERLLFRQMRSCVDAADVDDYFSPELRQRITDMCFLFQQHFFDFYADRHHPHSDKTLNTLV